MTDQVAIESEIRAGLQRNERARIDDARACLDFYRGDFTRYPVRQPDDSTYDRFRYQRNSLVMKRIVSVLTANLYGDGPKRSLPDHTEAETWLNECYRSNAFDALMQEADRLSTAGDVCLIQAEGTTDPDCPVKVTLWDSSSFTIWVDPDDPRKPIAVAVIDCFDNARRLRLWTDDELVTFRTDKMADGQTSGATAYKFVDRVPNPYGALPFASVHFQFPATDFWSGGIGASLRSANDYINFHMTDSGDTLRYNGKPIILAENVAPGWRPPMPIKPGDIWDIPAGDVDAGGNGPGATVSYLQADLGFVTASWEDLQQFLDHTLEMAGVPPGTIRMRLDAASGVAIVAEQVPLILWAQSRQRPFGFYEAAIAKLVLMVGSKHLGSQEYPDDPYLTDAYRATSAQLAAAAAHPGLVLRWPDMFPYLPGPDRDQADQSELDMGITSRIRILMRRRGLTYEEAVEDLKQIAEDRKLEAQLLGTEANEASDDSKQPNPKPPTEPEGNDDGRDNSDDDEG